MHRTVFCLIISLFVSLPGYAVAEKAISYHIGPGDAIEISVWRNEALSRDIVVPPDGIISFPLIRDTDTNNMSVKELRENLTKRLSEFVPDSPVTVILTKVNSLKAYVIGKVYQPGLFSISMDTTIMQILAQAGGLNPFASERKIHILRQRNGTTIKIPFDYKEVLKGENLYQNILLQRGDVVVVP